MLDDSAFSVEYSLGLIVLFVVCILICMVLYCIVCYFTAWMANKLHHFLHLFGANQRRCMVATVLGIGDYSQRRTVRSFRFMNESLALSCLTVNCYCCNTSLGVEIRHTAHTTKRDVIH